jgi:hypothetical protein
MTRSNRLKRLHNKSSNHRDKLMAENICSCFYCCKKFIPSSIYEWVDSNDTALCPYCGIDSVVPGDIDDVLLKEMQDYWFNTFYDKDGKQVEVKR